MTDTKNQSPLVQLETMLEEYFGKKAPALPENWKELLVKIAPYLSIVSIVLAIPALLLVFGLGGVATALAPVGGTQSMAAVPSMWLSTGLLVVTIVLEGLAIQGLFARKYIGWKYLYWSQIVSVVASLLQFNLVGAIIGGAIGFYVLFQVKSYYK